MYSSLEEKDPLVVEPLEKVVLDGPEKLTYVSSLLSSEGIIAKHRRVHLE